MSRAHKKLTAVLLLPTQYKGDEQCLPSRKREEVDGRAALAGGPSSFQPIVQLSCCLIRTTGGALVAYAANVSFCISARVSTNAKCRADALDSPPF